MTDKTAKGTLNSRIGRRITGLFVFCALIPLALLALLSLTQVSKELSKEAERDLHRTAKGTGMTLLERLLIMEMDLELAIGEIVRNGRAGFDLPAPLRTRLAGKFRALAHHAHDGRTTLLLPATTPVLPKLTSVDKEHLAKDKTLIKTVTGAGYFAEVMLVRALQAGRPERGLMFAIAKPEALWHAEGVKPVAGELLVIDSSGQILINTSNYAPITELSKAAAYRPASGWFQWDGDGENHMAGYWQLFVRASFNTDWTIVHSRRRTVVLRALTSFQILFILATLLSFLIVVILSRFLIGRTLTPITKLHRATRRVAEGNFSVQVEIESNDEFADLGTSFNDMQGELLENIRRREQTEKELVLAHNAAIAAAQTEIRFISNVSHELRTPLTSILSFTELLQDYEDLPPETREEFIAIIGKQAHHLHRLIEDVLQLSRLQDERAEVQFDEVHVLETLHTGIARRPKAEKDRISVEADSDLPVLQGHGKLLRQLWSHLIDNAVNYSDPGTPVVIRVKALNSRIVVEVQDHGIGIAKEDQRAIFDRFHQIDDDILTEKNKGTGLGLAIAQDIVHRHGGEITVESAPQMGSTFRVELPVASGPQQHSDPQVLRNLRAFDLT